MPLTSKSQLRKCHVLKKEAEQKGETPSWNCSEAFHKTRKFSKLPDYKIRTGPRGGKYIIKQGKKIYVSG